MFCYVCRKKENKSHLLVINVQAVGPNQKVECRICGDYIYNTDADLTLTNLDERTRAILSAILRERKLRSKTTITLEYETVDKLIKENPVKSVPQKLNYLLLTLSRLTKDPGFGVKLDIRYDYPLAYASGQKELSYLIDALSSQGYLRDDNKTLATISPKGWERVGFLEEHTSESDKVFVAMNFDKTYNALWNAIKEVIAEAGFNPIRSDKKEHVNLIDDFILTQIKESRFIVADFTGQKHGVYFEAGYARGLGIPVIWMCKKKTIDKLHFDVNHYNQIDWKSHEDLSFRLSNRIKGLAGELTTKPI